MNTPSDRSEQKSKQSDNSKEVQQLPNKDKEFVKHEDMDLVGRNQSPRSNGVRSNYVERGYDKLSPGKHDKLNDNYASAVDYREAHGEYLENLNLNEQTSSHGAHDDPDRDVRDDHQEENTDEVEVRISAVEAEADENEDDQVDDAQTSSRLTKKIAANYPGSNADSEASGGQQLCDVHGKNVQGYCLEDRRVLCIDCILSGDHKNHEICAIDKAAKQERDGLTKKFQHAKLLKDMLGGSILKIRSHEEVLRSTTADYIQKVSATIQEVRQQLEERERQIVAELEAKLQKELKHLSTKEREALTQLEHIEQFQAQWHQLGDLDDAYFLKNIEQQDEEAARATAEPKQVRYNQVVPAKFIRENEVASLSKYILSCAPILGATGGGSMASNQAPTREYFQTISAPESAGINVTGKMAEDRAAQRGKARRDASFVGKGSMLSGPTRSTSIKPAAGISQGGGQVDNPNHNSSLQGTNNSSGKASYMQATSSWAKRQAIKDDQKHLEKRQSAKPGFKLHLGHSLHQTSKESPAPVQINLQPSAKQVTDRNERVAGRDAQNSQRDTLRRERLYSRDKKIQHAFNATAALNQSSRQKTMTGLTLAQNLSQGHVDLTASQKATNTARSPTQSVKNSEATQQQNLPPRSVKASGDTSNLPASDKKRNPKKSATASLHNSHLQSRQKQSSALGFGMPQNSLTNQKVTPTKKPAPSSSQLLLGASKEKHYLNPKLRARGLGAQVNNLTAQRSEKSDVKVLEQDRPKGSFQAAAAARTRSQVRQVNQSFTEQENNTMLRKVEQSSRAQQPRRAKGWPARVNTSLGQVNDRSAVTSRLLQDKSDHHPLTAAALEKDGSGDDANSSYARDFDDIPVVGAHQSAEHCIVDSGAVPERAAVDLRDLNSAAVSLRPNTHLVSRDTDAQAINSAQVSSRGLDPCLNSFQKAAALRKQQRESENQSPVKDQSSAHVSPAKTPPQLVKLSLGASRVSDAQRASVESSRSGRSRRNRRQRRSTVSSMTRSQGDVSAEEMQQQARLPSPIGTKTARQPLTALAQRRDEFKNWTAAERERSKSREAHEPPQRYLNSTIEPQPLKELIEMPSQAESSSSQHEAYQGKQQEDPVPMSFGNTQAKTQGNQDLLTKLREIHTEISQGGKAEVDYAKRRNPYEDLVSDQCQTIADYDGEDIEMKIKSPNMLRTSHQRSDKKLKSGYKANETSMSNADIQPIATASINLVAGENESVVHIGNMSMNRTRQALIGGDDPLGTHSELGELTHPRQTTILTEESAQSPVRAPAQRASQGLLREELQEETEQESDGRVYRDEGALLKQSINSALPAQRKHEEHFGEMAKTEYMTNPLLTSEHNEPDNTKESQGAAHKTASVAGRSTRQKWQTNRKNSVRETSLPRQLAQDNAQQFELARADPQFQRNATMVTPGGYDLGTEHRNDVMEESKQPVVRVDPYSKHIKRSNYVEEAHDAMLVIQQQESQTSLDKPSNRSLAQYLDVVNDKSPQQKSKTIKVDVTKESLDISYLRSPERDSANRQQHASSTSATLKSRREVEPMFAIYCISGYCDSPLVSTEKISITLASLNNPEQFWTERAVKSRMDHMDYQSASLGSSTHQTGGWVMAGDLNVARTKFQAVVLPRWTKVNRMRDQLWILGGKNAQSQRIDSIEIYDQQNEIWCMDPERIHMRKPKSGFAAVYYRGGLRGMQEQLLIIGGNDGQVQNRVEFMNLQDHQWHKCASMISRRDELAACVGPDNMIYAIGGYGGSANSSCLNSVERYDCAANRWEAVAPMNEGRRALAAIAMPDGIYAIGGYNGKDYIASVERYDINADKWTIISSLNSPKCTMTAVASPNFKTFYVIGGFNGMQLNEVEIYDAQTQRFRLMKYSLAQKRFMHSSAVLIN